MRPIVALLLCFAAASLAADPTADQLALVKTYDGQSFSTAGLKLLKAQDNGWSQYQWTQGRFLWNQASKGWFAVVEPSGATVYRISASEYRYEFPDGRIIRSNPGAGTLKWNPMVGDQAPDFSLPAPDGKTVVKLSALRGQVVLLDFWASWCGPCQQALPGTERLHQTYKDRGLKVLGVNIEGDAARAQANIRSLKLTFPTVMAQADASGQADWKAVQIADYGIDSIPRGVLIDKKGIIRANDNVVEDTGLIEKLLAE